MVVCLKSRAGNMVEDYGVTATCGGLFAAHVGTTDTAFNRRVKTCGYSRVSAVFLSRASLTGVSGGELHMHAFSNLCTCTPLRIHASAGCLLLLHS